jgi:hypothetical protein
MAFCFKTPAAIPQSQSSRRNLQYCVLAGTGVTNTKVTCAQVDFETTQAAQHIEDSKHGQSG